MLQHLQQCFAQCSDTLVWKIFVMLGRFSAMEGNADSARAVLPPLRSHA